MSKTDIAPAATDDNRDWSIGATNNVKVDAIKSIDRILPPTQARIDAMANALGERGQLAPILVTKYGDTGWRVVAGATRLAAAVELGWEYIKSTIVSGTEQQLKLMEIEENLERAHLTDDERGILKAKEKELRAERLTAFEAALEETPPTPATAKGGRSKKGGVRAAARKAGVSEPTARRRAAKLRHDAVSEEADKAKVRELDAAVKKAKAERDAAKPTTKSVSKSTPVDIATRLLTELIAHGLKADPDSTAWAMRKKLPGSIGKLAGWLERFTAELFIDANRENQPRILDIIGIDRLIGGMSSSMLDLLRERVAQNIKTKAAKNAPAAPESSPPSDKTVH